MWCRGKIIELMPLQKTNELKPRGPTKYKICDIAMMKIFLVDFGHIEALIISRYTFLPLFATWWFCHIAF